MKKRLLSAGILAACIGIVLAVLAMLPPRSNVTKANYDRITVGMTRTEVDAIFASKGRRFDGYVGKPALCWENDDRSYALICFDENEKVIEKAQWNDSPETIMDKVRRLIRWPWW